MRLKRFYGLFQARMPLQGEQTRPREDASQVRLLPACRSAFARASMQAFPHSATQIHSVYFFTRCPVPTGANASVRPRARAHCAVLYLRARTRAYVPEHAHALCARVHTLSNTSTGSTRPPHSQPKVYLHTRICICALARARRRPHANVQMHTRTRAYNRTSTCTQHLHISRRTHHMPLPPSLLVSALLSICIHARHMHTCASIRERAPLPTPHHSPPW